MKGVCLSTSLNNLTPKGGGSRYSRELFALVRTRDEDEGRAPGIRFSRKGIIQRPQKTARADLANRPSFCWLPHRYPRRARKARVVQRSDAGRKTEKPGLIRLSMEYFGIVNPKKAEHSGNIIPMFAKLKTYRRDGQGFGGASNAFAKLAGSAGSWSILSGETTVTGMFG